MKLEFSQKIFEKNIWICNFMKIHPVGAESLHVDGWTNRHDKINSRFLQFCEHI